MPLRSVSHLWIVSHLVCIVGFRFVTTFPPRGTRTYLRSSGEIRNEATIEAVTVEPPQILPAGRPLNSFITEDHIAFNADNDASVNKTISILSWNILLPNSQDNWWNHKMYAPWVPMDKRQWSHRQSLIRERVLLSGADIICIQEADGNTFEKDFAFMKDAGYQNCLHKKFRFRCATFFKEDKFVLEQVAHKDRCLVISLRSTYGVNQRLLHVVNCHLSGGAAPERRLRQTHEGVEQIRKWKAKVAATLEKQRKANRPSPRNIRRAEEELALYANAGVIVCGDLNSDGNTGVRRFLVEGSVSEDWREPQYPDVRLTTKRKEHSHSFVDAAELAYGSNVCDGDYGEDHARLLQDCRMPTYVVPNLASLLLMPTKGDSLLRTQFGPQVAKGLVNTLGIKSFSKFELNRAFESIDLDGNNFIDEDECNELLESVYIATYQRSPTEEERIKFLRSGMDFPSTTNDLGLSREQLADKLMALREELEGGAEGVELVEVRTEADAQRMIGRFSGQLRKSLDYVFDKFSYDGEALSEEEVAKFLIKTNGQMGRGGTWRHTSAMFEAKRNNSMPVFLTRKDWYGVFARELGEGKWWQVVYDLEVCGANLRSNVESAGTHYQGWLDYIYFDSQQLTCLGVQEALTSDELSRIFVDGDALPNAWHPSDHLPVSALLCWKDE